MEKVSCKMAKCCLSDFIKHYEKNGDPVKSAYLIGCCNLQNKPWECLTSEDKTRLRYRSIEYMTRYQGADKTFAEYRDVFNEDFAKPKFDKDDILEYLTTVIKYSKLDLKDEKMRKDAITCCNLVLQQIKDAKDDESKQVILEIVNEVKDATTSEG